MHRACFAFFAVAFVAVGLAVGGGAPAWAGDQGKLDTAGFHPPDGFFEGPVLVPDGGPPFRVGRPAADELGSSGDWVTFAYSWPPTHDLAWQTVAPTGYLPPCVTSFPGAVFEPFEAAFDEAGRLLIGGQVEYGDDTLLFVARFLYPSCTLDTTFDSDGYFTFAFASTLDFARLGFVTTGIPPFLTQKILVAATVRYWTPGVANDAIVLRLLPDGQLDTTFSTDGIQLLEYGNEGILVRDLVVDPQDRIVLLSTVGVGDPAVDVLLTRLLPNGTVDSTFGSSGWRRFHQTSADRVDLAAAILRAPGGDLYVVGNSVKTAAPQSNRIVVTRLAANGATLSETIWPVPPLALVRGAVLQGDLRLLLLSDLGYGATDDFFTMAWTIPALALDPAYNDPSDFEPRTIVDLGNPLVPDAAIFGLALSNQRPVVSGYEYDASGTVPVNVPFLARLENDLIFADGFESASTSAW